MARIPSASAPTATLPKPSRACPQPVEQLICEPKKLLEVPGIGRSMAEKLQEICKQGKLSLHTQLLEKYQPSMLELLKIQGLGPKTISLIWSAYKISDL